MEYTLSIVIINPVRNPEFSIIDIVYQFAPSFTLD